MKSFCPTEQIDFRLALDMMNAVASGSLACLPWRGVRSGSALKAAAPIIL
jgi:hypothetical protein